MDKHFQSKNNAFKKILNTFPPRWRNSFDCLDLKNLSEIRIRANQPIIINFLTKKYYLTPTGVANTSENCIIATKKEIEEIVFLLCNKSIYSYLPQLINGFIHYDGGIRIGVCGETICNDNKIINLKNFTSLNIRIPHIVKNCSLPIKKFYCNPLKNVLIISKPGCGKTTFLRDMLYQLKDYKHNALIIDEREEIIGLDNDVSNFDLNNSFDTIFNCDKRSAIEWGIRSMSPELIVCDEIFFEDMQTLEIAVKSGVKIFATTHSDNLENTFEKLKLEFNNIFELFILLTDKNGPGTISGLFEKTKKKIL